VVGFSRPEALLVPVRHARRARRPWFMLRPLSGDVACSSPTTRSTRRERSLAAARPGRHRGCLPAPRRTARQAGRSRGPLRLRRRCDGLAFDSRRATRDVDALFEPHGIVHEEALAVAAELGLPRWPRDAEDIRQLIGVLGLRTADDVFAMVREIFPEEEPPQRLRLLLEDIFTQKE